MEDKMMKDRIVGGKIMEGKIMGFMEENLNVSRSTQPLSGDIARAAGLIVECLKGDGKILVMGNGGSASQASHFAGELVGRYRRDRKGLPCIALTTDTSVITAVGNDYGFDRIFERQVEALAKKGDVIIGLSTSGKSENVIKALGKGREIGCRLVTLTGKDGGVMRTADANINIASDSTPRVQEMHLMILHIICELVEVNSE